MYFQRSGILLPGGSCSQIGIWFTVSHFAQNLDCTQYCSNWAIEMLKCDRALLYWGNANTYNNHIMSSRKAENAKTICETLSGLFSRYGNRSIHHREHQWPTQPSTCLPLSFTAASNVMQLNYSECTKTRIRTGVIDPNTHSRAMATAYRMSLRQRRLVAVHREGCMY